MPKMHPEWLKELTNKNLPPILGVGGEERAFVDEAITEVKKRVLFSGMPEFNFDALSAKQAPMKAIVNSAKTLPVMAPLRLVLVTEADALKSDDFEIFEAYLKSPSPSTVLLFVFEQIDTRVKLQKALDASGRLFKFDHPKEREMLALIKSRAAARSLKLSEETAGILLLEIGSSLLMLDRALEKLELACVDGVVTPAAVEEQVAQTAFRDTFALARSVALKDRALVAKNLAELKKAQEVPLRLIGVLAWQFRIVLKARLYLDERRQAADIGAKLNLFGDRLQMVLKAARLLDAKAQIKRLNQLAELDCALKTSRVPAWLVFEQAVLDLVCQSYRHAGG